MASLTSCIYLLWLHSLWLPTSAATTGGVEEAEEEAEEAEEEEARAKPSNLHLTTVPARASSRVCNQGLLLRPRSRPRAPGEREELEFSFPNQTPTQTVSLIPTPRLYT